MKLFYGTFILDQRLHGAYNSDPQKVLRARSKVPKKSFIAATP